MSATRMLRNGPSFIRLACGATLLATSVLLLGAGCTEEQWAALEESESAAVDLTDAILVGRSGDCGAYADFYESFVVDIQRTVAFEGMVEIEFNDTTCTLTSNGIPNHDFNDLTASFASNVAERTREFKILRTPSVAAFATSLSQRSWDAVMLNGVVLDLLSAGCYRPLSPMADAQGNVQIGCSTADPWLLDPLFVVGGFGTDLHNAHVQPDGTYHYHGDPVALFDDMPGIEGSPVIGFAADGFPIFGSYFNDGATVRKAVSGYTLKAGMRPDGPEDPGGDYTGLYIDDFEFTDAGDLDACNGMELDGQYGYYVTESYPWVLNCFTGSPDVSFEK